MSSGEPNCTSRPSSSTPTLSRRERLRLVVRDVHGGRAHLADQRGDLHAHPLAQVGVQVGQWFVAQDQPGVGDQRAGERDTLLLAAGQLVRVSSGELGQPHSLEHRQGTGPALGATDPAAAQRERHVVQRGHVRPQRVVLEHHRQVTLLGGHMRTVGRHGPSADGDQPAVDSLDAGQAPQQRRLAGPGRTEQHEERPRATESDTEARWPARTRWRAPGWARSVAAPAPATRRAPGPRPRIPA